MNCKFLVTHQRRAILIVPNDHRLAGKEQVELVEVAHETFIILKTETALRDVIEKLYYVAGFQPTIITEVFEDRTVAGLVGAKFGVALIPLLPGLDKSKISVIRTRKPKCLRVIQMVWRTNKMAIYHLQSYISSPL